MAKVITRTLFGVTLLCIGVVHYMTFSDFRALVRQGLEAGPDGVLPPGAFLAPVADAWAFVLPALMVIGGALLVLQMFPVISAALISIALGSIAAGMLLKSVLGTVSLAESMPAAANTFIWIVIFLLSASGKSAGLWSVWAGCGCKGGCSGKGCCGMEKTCTCGSKDCPVCGDKEDRSAKPSTFGSAPSAASAAPMPDASMKPKPQKPTRPPKAAL